MANSRIPGPLGLSPGQPTDWHVPLMCAPHDQGAFGAQALRDTPGPLGFMDWADPSLMASAKGAKATGAAMSTAITTVQLKKIFPGAQYDHLSRIADELNVDPTSYGLGSALQKAHFFAQVREECGPRLEVRVENLNYSPKLLKLNFSYYAKNPNEAVSDGYATDEKTKKVVRRADTEQIANKVYANRIGNGDAESGDGWKFRGRGLIQITGRANYAACSKKYRVLYPGADDDFEKNPELLEQFSIAVRSAVCYWIQHGLDLLADGSGDAKVDRITAVINKKTTSYPERREHFKVAYDAFA